jgi:F-type H+-transporting ATPase subunit b
MTIDPLTFILEIVNFLVLLWLLKRFLYAPIRDAITLRQQTLNHGLQEAETRELEARDTIEAYRRHLDDWNAEKAGRHHELNQELAKERDAALARTRELAEAERLRLHSLLQQELDSEKQAARDLSGRTALAITRLMLERLAGSELDQALLRMLIDDLGQLAEPELAALQTAAVNHQGRCLVASARPLGDARLYDLQSALSRLVGMEVSCTPTVEPQLLSGVRLTLGDRVLHANLGDELAFFERSMTGGN